MFKPFIYIVVFFSSVLLYACDDEILVLPDDYVAGAGGDNIDDNLVNQTKLEGTWDLVSYGGTSKTTIEAAGVVVESNTLFNASNIDATLTFAFDPNVSVTNGSYDLESEITSMGQTYTENEAIAHDNVDHSFILEGNIIKETSLLGQSSDFVINQLTQYSLVLETKDTITNDISGSIYETITTSIAEFRK